MKTTLTLLTCIFLSSCGPGYFDTPPANEITLPANQKLITASVDSLGYVTVLTREFYLYDQPEKKYLREYNITHNKVKITIIQETR
jgi:hypothetical protein